MNSLWLRQLSPSMSKSLNTVSSTFSESSWPVAIVTARLNWAVGRRKKKKKIYVWKIGRKLQTDLTDRETVPMPTGRLASVTIFIEKAKSSRLLVNRQKALNSSNAILYKRKHDSWLSGHNKSYSDGTEWRKRACTWPAGIFFLMFSQ